MSPRHLVTLSATAVLALGGLVAGAPALAAEEPASEPQTIQTFEAPDAPEAAPTFNEISERDHFANGEVPDVISGTYSETDDGQLTIQIIKGWEGDDDAGLLHHDVFDVSGGTWSYDISDFDFADNRYFIMVGVQEGVSHRGTEVHFTVGSAVGYQALTVDEPADKGTYYFSEGLDRATGTGEPGATIDYALTGAREAMGATTISNDGTWAIPFDADGAPLPVGDYSATIRQHNDFLTPETVSLEFQVIEDEEDTDDPDTDEPTDPELPTFNEISEGDQFGNGEVPGVISGTYSETDDGQLTIQIIKGWEGDDDAGLLHHDVFDVSGGTWSYDISDFDFADNRYFIMVGVQEGVSHRGTEVHFTVGDPASDYDPADISVVRSSDGVPFVDGTAFSATETPELVAGTGQPGATIEAELTGAAESTGTYTVAEDGSWSVPLEIDGAPLPAGDYALDVTQIVPGEAPQTASITFSVVDVDATEYAEVAIGDIVDGALYSGAIDTASGTGEPGATVRVVTGGDQFEEPVSQQTEVAADGTWRVELEQPYESSAEARLNAYQVVDGVQVGSAAVDFSVFSAIRIDSIADGDRFAAADAPSGARGAIDPALAELDAPLSFLVALDGRSGEALPADEVDVAIEDDGTWNADFGDALPAGEYELTASVEFGDEGQEALNHIDDASVAFTIETDTGTDRENEEPTVDDDEEPTGTGDEDPNGTDEDASTGTNEAETTTSTGELAVTGGASTMPYAIGAAGLLLAGGASVLIARRMRA